VSGHASNVSHGFCWRENLAGRACRSGQKQVDTNASSCSSRQDLVGNCHAGKEGGGVFSGVYFCFVYAT
jgi:hypothetical protein